jgi:hypothetical protein
MLNHWLIDLIGHVSGLSDAQLRQIEQSLPATKALIDLLNRAQPIIEQAQSLYAEAQPLIDEAKKEWQTVGPAAQILIDVISHHVDQGRSPAEAAETVRTALDGSIKSVAQDHWMDRDISCVTVFGGTGFIGRRVARNLRASGATVRVASRRPRRAEGDSLEQIAADASSMAKLSKRRVDKGASRRPGWSARPAGRSEPTCGRTGRRICCLLTHLAAIGAAAENRTLLEVKVTSGGDHHPSSDIHRS